MKKKKIRSAKQAADIRYGILLARHIAPKGFKSEDGRAFQATHGMDTLLNTDTKRAFYFTAENLDKLP